MPVSSATEYRPASGGASTSNPTSGTLRTQSLFERRKNKLAVGRQPLNLQLNKHTKSPLERLLDELDQKLFDEKFSPIGSPVVSSDGTLKMYRVPCHDQQKIMIHSLRPHLRPQAKYSDAHEDFSGSFWRMVEHEGSSVCALANPGDLPIYMPPQDNSRAIKSLPLNVGDCRRFSNGIRVDVVQVDLLADLKKTVLKHKRDTQRDSLAAREVRLISNTPSTYKPDSPIAREVHLKLTASPQNWVRETPESVDNKSPRAAKKVKVCQFFSCWSDSEPLAPEIAQKIVSRLTSPILQLHCEGGENRSPAAAAMILLNKKRESLFAHNLLDEVAGIIKYIRRCCHNDKAMDRSARISVLHFALRITELTPEHLLSFCKKPAMTSPLPRYFQDM